MKIIGMLRVKNEARWIERCLQSILPICDSVIVMDDHSDDDTLYRCQALPKVNAFESPFHGLDEARDKNHMLAIVEREQPDWIVAIDGDEMLASGSLELLQKALKALHSRWPCLSLRVRYLWDREDQVRVDGVYGDFHRESVFRPNGTARFVTAGSGAHFHCGNVPAAIRQKRTVLRDVVLLHFGYLHRKDRERKYAWYNAQDPENLREDRYRHMVIGDVFPADSRFAHGGPLQLEALS